MIGSNSKLQMNENEVKLEAVKKHSRHTTLTSIDLEASLVNTDVCRY